MLGFFMLKIEIKNLLFLPNPMSKKAEVTQAMQYFFFLS